MARHLSNNVDEQGKKSIIMICLSGLCGVSFEVISFDWDSWMAGKDVRWPGWWLPIPSCVTLLPFKTNEKPLYKFQAFPVSLTL